MTATASRTRLAPRRTPEPVDRQCGICTATIRPGEQRRPVLDLGICHTDCADEIARGAEEGGCDPSEYARIFGQVMHPE